MSTISEIMIIGGVATGGLECLRTGGTFVMQSQAKKKMLNTL